MILYWSNCEDYRTFELSNYKYFSIGFQIFVAGILPGDKLIEILEYE